MSDAERFPWQPRNAQEIEKDARWVTEALISWVASFNGETDKQILHPDHVDSISFSDWNDIFYTTRKYAVNVGLIYDGTEPLPRATMMLFSADTQLTYIASSLVELTGKLTYFDRYIPLVEIITPEGDYTVDTVTGELDPYKNFWD